MNHRSSNKNKKEHFMKVRNTHDMQSPVMNEILNKCQSIASSNKSVLIVGEYGSGKGWIARKIHDLSDRKDRRFSRINCYTMQAEEIKKKLYGFLSFTDLSARINRGILEETDGGTIFFEGFEVLPLHLQYQILESIQNKSISHLGSSLSINADVRLITSMYGNSYNNNQNGSRSENSIFEINPITIFQPPLRNRREDIAFLIDHFLNYELLEKFDSIVTEISPRALYLCIQYDWPGNIRQLKNAMKLALLLSEERSLEPQHLQPSICNGQPRGGKLLELQKSKSFQAAEKYLIQRLLQNMDSCDGIASSLGINIKLLDEKLTKYELSKPKYKTKTID